MGCGQYVVATPTTRETEKVIAKTELDQVFALESAIASIQNQLSSFTRKIEAQDYRFANKATDPLSATNESVECPICLLRYNDHSEQPLSLPCGHVFCKSCMEEHYKLSAATKCPFDRTEHEVAPRDLPLALHLLDAQQEKDKALTCERHRLPLVSYCTPHKRFLCRRCSHIQENCIELGDPALEKDLFAGVVTALLNRKMVKAALETSFCEAQEVDEEVATSFAACVTKYEQASEELEALKLRIQEYCTRLDSAAEELFRESRYAANAAHSVFQETAKAAEFLENFDSVPEYTKLSCFIEGCASLHHMTLEEPDDRVLRTVEMFSDYHGLVREINNSQ